MNIRLLSIKYFYNKLLEIVKVKSWFDEDRVKWITERFSAPDIKFYENPVMFDNNTDEIIS